MWYFVIAMLVVFVNAHSSLNCRVLPTVGNETHPYALIGSSTAASG
jgi:hypothetical protein